MLFNDNTSNFKRERLDFRSDFTTALIRQVCSSQMTARDNKKRVYHSNVKKVMTHQLV